MSVFVVLGLGFGDCGKGHTVAYLAQKHNADLVVRFNGGGQAAHNVTLADGRHHTFSQFGSGSFTPGCRTHLSQHMTISPGAMLAEEDHLVRRGVHNAFERITIAETALVTSRFQVAANRLL